MRQLVLHAVILAGGRGERFWQLSRGQRPKQLLKLLGPQTLLEDTLRRVALEIPPERRWVVAGEALRPQMSALGSGETVGNFIWEPVGRNTAAAIGAAAEMVLACEEDAELLVLPCDHWIPDSRTFWESVGTGRRLIAAGHDLVTFGIVPAYPETGYGYVERAGAVPDVPGAWLVARFHEKPDVEVARGYLERGGFFWNSGIFLLRAQAVATLLRRHIPQMAEPLDRLREAARQGPGETAWRRYFESATSISFDHGVMERAGNSVMVEAGFAWNDLGTWTSWGERIEPDSQGNRVRGAVLAEDAANCILYSDAGGLLAVLGVHDLIVVRTGDATLVCPKDRAQEVRRLVQRGVSAEDLRGFF